LLSSKIYHFNYEISASHPAGFRRRGLALSTRQNRVGFTWGQIPVSETSCLIRIRTTGNFQKVCHCNIVNVSLIVILTHRLLVFITTALLRHYNCTVASLQLHCCVITTALLRRYNCTVASLQLHCCVITTALLRHYSCTVASLQLHCCVITTSLLRRYTGTLVPYSNMFQPCHLQDAAE
jgi:hypothetical protein